MKFKTLVPLFLCVIFSTQSFAVNEGKEKEKEEKRGEKRKIDDENTNNPENSRKKKTITEENPQTFNLPSASTSLQGNSGILSYLSGRERGRAVLPLSIQIPILRRHIIETFPEFSKKLIEEFLKRSSQILQEESSYEDKTRKLYHLHSDMVKRLEPLLVNLTHEEDSLKLASFLINCLNWFRIKSEMVNQVGTQILASPVWDQLVVRAQVGDHVGAGDQIWNEIEDHVGVETVRNQVWVQVGTQIRNQVLSRVRAQIGNQVWPQIENQVRYHIGAYLWSLPSSLDLESALPNENLSIELTPVITYVFLIYQLTSILRIYSPEFGLRNNIARILRNNFNSVQISQILSNFHLPSSGNPLIETQLRLLRMYLPSPTTNTTTTTVTETPSTTNTTTTVTAPDITPTLPEMPSPFIYE